MEKLIRGIVDFQAKKAFGYKELFSKLALGQSPDTFFLACSDSRVAVNVFASTDPGDLFVMRNVGNLFPSHQNENGDSAPKAVLEFAVHELKVKHIVVCGHSECGGMKTLIRGLNHINYEGLKKWLKHGEGSLQNVDAWVRRFPGLEPHNALSQINVINQIKNIKSHPFVNEKVVRNELHIHGLWFDIKNLLVYYYFEEKNQFDVISEQTLDLILKNVINF